MPPGYEARPRRPPAGIAFAPPGAGRVVVTASLGGTAVFAVSAVAAAVAPRALGVPALAVALALFGGGIVAFGWSFLVAAARSRSEAVSLLGVYGLSGTAPAGVRARLFGSLAVETAVAVVTAAVRVNTTLSFGILVPTWGLGLVGLWGARHGVFAPRRAGRGPGP